MKAKCTRKKPTINSLPFPIYNTSSVDDLKTSMNKYGESIGITIKKSIVVMMSNFSFCHNVFIIRLLQMLLIAFTDGKWLKNVLSTYSVINVN